MMVDNIFSKLKILVGIAMHIDALNHLKAHKLKVISCHNYYDIDVKTASEHLIQIIIPTIYDAVADMTFAFMLSTARNMPQAYTYIRNGLWKQTTEPKIFFSRTGIFGKTLCIIGLGRIGAIVAKRMKGFEMRILYYDTGRKSKLEKNSFEFRPLKQL